MTRFAIIPFILAVLAFVTAPARAVEASLETLDGRTVVGELTTWDAEQAVLTTSSGDVAVATGELLGIAFSAAPNAASQTESPPIVVRLHDGSRLPAQQLTVSNRRATIETSLATAPLELPTNAIELIELAPQNEPAARVWGDLQQRELPGDVLLILKKDGAAVDYLAGVVGEITAEVVQFEWEGDRIPVKRSKVAAVAFYRRQANSDEPATCRLHLTSGAVVAAASVQRHDDELRVELASGGALTVAVADVAAADYSLGKLAYLGDERPLSVRWTPLIGLPAGAETIAAYGEPRFNRSFSGGPIALRIPGASDEGAAAGRLQEFSRGLALRSRTEIVYDVPSGMTRFAATAGIAPYCATEGRVVLTVYGDREPLWEGAVAGEDAPHEIAVELGAARRLRIVVDYGENLDYGDELHLARARFVK